MKRILLLACLFILPIVANAGTGTEKDPYIVGTDATWPPFEYVDDSKKVVGYSSDYIKAVAKEAGFFVEVRNTAWDGIFAALENGQVDIVASSVTITPERQVRYDFSDPYFEIFQALTVPNETDIKSLADLKGKTVGGQIGTTGLIVMEKLNVGAKIKSYDEVGLAIEDLKNGRIDAVMCDDSVASFYSERKEGYADKLNVLLKTEEVEYYGFTVKKGNQALIDKLNQGVKAVKEKGIEDELIKKWI